MHAAVESSARIAPEPSEWQVILARVEAMWGDLLASTPRLAIAVVALLLTWLVASLTFALLRRVLAGTHLRASLQDLLRQLVYAALWILGLLVAANIAFPDLTPGKTLTALGIGSIAIGFAFKDIFENFFAGILILWRFPFENGDFIRCGDLVGKVERTTIRMTVVRQVDGRIVVVPNARLFKEPVEVLTNEGLARVEVEVGIAYREDIDAARAVMLAALREQPTVAQSRPLDAQVDAFGSSSIDFRVMWWTGSEPRARRDSRDQVLTAIKRGLDEAGIEIPFPYRTLTWGKGEPEKLRALVGSHGAPPVEGDAD